MIDSTAFLELEKLPQRIVFIGGGFISFEFAHFAAQLGPAKNQITIPMADLYRQSVLAPYPSRESDWLYMLKPFAP